jgi:sugar lactone lactonase YvrE
LAPTSILSLTVLAGIVSWAADVLGTRPGYLTSAPGSVPNEQAILKRIWAPGLDDGYVPQGLTYAEGAILLSGYRSTDPNASTGPCRVYRVDPASGRYTGQFDLPADCGHAGGLAYVRNGSLVVSDTRRLYKIDMQRAFQDGHAQNALQSVVRLGGNLKGSFAGFDGTDLWIGSSEDEESKARIHRVSLKLFDEFNERGTIREDRALSVMAIGVDGQGATVDRQGNLWLTFSNSRRGVLQKVDPRSGGVAARYDMVIGIEDVTFDDEGRLWSVSEAGSKRWLRWSVSFPVIFQVDVSRLR